MKITLEGQNRTNKVLLEGNIGDIDSKSIYIYYGKLLDKSKSNKKKTVKLDTLYVVSNLAEFSYRSFWGFNHSKKYWPKVKNIKIRLTKPREIVHVQNLLFFVGKCGYGYLRVFFYYLQPHISLVNINRKIR